MWIEFLLDITGETKRRKKLILGLITQAGMSTLNSMMHGYILGLAHGHYDLQDWANAQLVQHDAEVKAANLLRDIAAWKQAQQEKGETK